MTNNTIMVVDDDPNIRLGLTKELEEEFGSMATVLSCENGAVASDLIRFHGIDILITDIKMPVMNGIELLKLIKEEGIACKSMVLSGFDDFNLVRDAMKYGAMDYLLKPVDLCLLNEAIYKLLSETSLLKEKGSDTASFLNHQKILEHYIKPGQEPHAQTLVFEEKYGLTDQSPCVSGCIKLSALHSGQAFEMQNRFRQLLYDVLHRLHCDYTAVLTGEYRSLWIFVVFSAFKSPLSQGRLSSIKREFSENGYNLQLSDGSHRRKDISLAVSQCMEGLELAFYDLPHTGVPEALKKQTEETLISGAVTALSQYCIGDALQCLTSFFVLMNWKKPGVNSLRRQISNLVYSLISENSRFIEPLSNCKFTEYDIFHQIETAETLSQLEKNLFASLNHLISETTASLPDQENALIERALQYIHRNYNDCITLNDTAAYVYLNKNSFSSLFKAKTGMTYREYLRNYRINQAIRMLRESDQKVYEIAQAVGYHDSAHFIRAFKEVTGKSPSGYGK